METNILLTPEQIPPSYCRCFQSDCPKSDSCARFLAGKHLPEGWVTGPAVYPTARQADTYYPRRLRFPCPLCRGEEERRYASARPYQDVFGWKHHLLPLPQRRTPSHTRATGMDHQPLPPARLYRRVTLRRVSRPLRFYLYLITTAW